ncbi:MAG: PilZ domain-containing protein [Planctomycetota bacterium]
MAERKGPDGRSAERIPCEGVLLSFQRKSGFFARLLGRDQKCAPVPVRNIGRDGVCFLSKKKLQVGEPLSLTIDLGPGHPTISLEGQVIWCDEGKGRYPWKAGVGFINIPKKTWAVLENIEQHCSERKKHSDTWRLHHTGRHDAKVGGALNYPGDEEESSPHNADDGS